MKRILLATAALCTISVGANARQPTPKPWFAYQIAEQTCALAETPARFAEIVRSMFKSDVQFHDTTDAVGSVTATRLSWIGFDGRIMEAHMFRDLSDCGLYAQLRRVDTSRYN